MKILLTGGASGLGKVITEAIGITNNKVIITYCNSKDVAHDLKNEFGIELIQCDYSSPESIENLISKIYDYNIDVLINNAFTGFKKQYFHKLSEGDFSDSFKNDILPVLKITQNAIKVFRKKKYGKIINILSSAIINRPPIGWSAYIAGKSYLLSMNKSWAVENAKFNITSNAISPSFMDTDMNKGLDSRILENMINAHPLKKLLNPEEVAKSVKYLIDSSQHINGANLIINSAENVI